MTRSGMMRRVSRVGAALAFALPGLGLQAAEPGFLRESMAAKDDWLGRSGARAPGAATRPRA